ncbi:MAG: hypothetical protein OQK04_19245 [Kangiellaceae bacterium]|nr:hypothetical protein [Kangiellaceae bacterium]MCW9000855.1 hypothetical protein [Kangiellaceae bacterium]
MKLLVLILLLLSSMDIFACTVVPKEDYTISNAMKADTIVVGRIVSSERIHNSLDSQLDVIGSTWIKGTGKQEFSIVEGMCSREFSVGKEYILLFRKGQMIGSLTYTKENLAKVYDDIR